MGNRTRNFIIAIVFVSFLGAAYPVGAQYSTGAYRELEAQDTTINKVSDWLATLGMTEDEKAILKSRRRAARKFKKNQRAILRKRKEIFKKKREAMRK